MEISQLHQIKNFESKNKSFFKFKSSYQNAS